MASVFKFCSFASSSVCLTDSLLDMKLKDKITKRSDPTPFYTIEFFLPKTDQGFSHLLGQMDRLSSLHPLAISVTWGAGGSTKDRSLDLAGMTQSECGIETILHFTCINVKGEMIDDALEVCLSISATSLKCLAQNPVRAQKSGVFKIFWLRAAARAIFCFVASNARDIYQGPPRGSEYWIPPDLRFVHAQDLVSYTRTSPEYSSNFCVGVAGYHDINPDQEVNEEEELVCSRQKFDAGADYIITQLFYDVDAFLSWINSPGTGQSPGFCVAPTAVIEVELSGEVPFPELIEALERIEGKAGKKEK
ncbi:FAD-linked oxidoreductase-like protein [Gautieria morchelliformis]|nr:FAD-linked oxidoreductase-like protein [Gautieria morchelliformis]